MAGLARACVLAVMTSALMLLGSTNANVEAPAATPPSTPGTGSNPPATAGQPPPAVPAAEGIAPLAVTPIPPPLPPPIAAPSLQTTPAQQQYGPPRNPMVGADVDMDLTKPITLERAVQIGLLKHNGIAIADLQALSGPSAAHPGSRYLLPAGLPGLPVSNEPHADAAR